MLVVAGVTNRLTEDNSISKYNMRNRKNAFRTISMDFYRNAEKNKKQRNGKSIDS